jgi:tetratricopeptide (TPR) repeat protein
VPSVEVTSETAFDLDAAFQSVLPNKQEAADETLAEEADALPELADVPQSREWDAPESSAAPAAPVADEAEVTTSLEASFESTDSVDDAFAELDRMTASIEADIAGIEADIASHAMLLPDDEYKAEEDVASPPATPQHVDALIGRTPDTDMPAIEQTPSAFVTETMAELYLQQGFREEAIAVYRQLLAMNPDDSVLAGRVRALEGGVEEIDERPLPSEEAARRDSYRLTPAAHADAVGQSMRAFLGVFARRRAPMRRREVVTNDVAAVAPPEPAQRESALSALFGAPPGADDGAAAVLAGAFAPPNAETEPLPGRPTRAAAQELSLGDVFAGSVAASGARAATFDEFFSSGSAEQPVQSPLDEEGSDMVQFTAWLEGLKKK